MKHINGLIAAPFTPFKESGELNLGIVDKQLELLIENDVTGAFVGGTTGEGMSLTVAERKILTEKWMEVKPEDFKLIIQCGHTTLAACKEIAGHARESGVDAVGAMGPVFHKPSTVEELVSFTEELASVTSDIPFYYYHIPSMTGIDFPMIEYLKLSVDRIPNLAGIKYTHEDLVDFKLCSEFGDNRYDMLYGRDETLLCGLTLGVKGAIGSTYNYYGNVYNKIIEAWQKEEVDRANELQLHIMKFIRILEKYGGGVVAGKAIMKLAGVNCGPPRSPLTGLSDRKTMDLKQELEEIDFFDYMAAGFSDVQEHQR